MIITIKELIFETIIGLLDFERITPQKVSIDCHIHYDYKDENSYINYALVTEFIETTMHKNQFELIETALLTIIDGIKENFPLSKKISLSITKPDIIDNAIVSVSYEKSFL